MTEGYYMVKPPTNTVVKAVNLSQGLMQAGKTSLINNRTSQSLLELPEITTPRSLIKEKQSGQVLTVNSHLTPSKSVSRLLETKQLKSNHPNLYISDPPHFFLRNGAQSELKYITPKSHSKPNNLFLPSESESCFGFPMVPHTLSSQNRSPQFSTSRTPDDFKHQTMPALKKRTIVLDLDETLIHASPQLTNPDHVISKHLQDGSSLIIRVNIRPYVQMFLQTISDFAEIIIFTASMKQYADPILDLLDPSHKLITSRYYRESCILHSTGYIKDLNIFNKPLKDILIVDNLASNFKFQKENGILIKSWFGEKSDTELLKLLKLLRKATLLDDMRNCDKSF